jgi:hypothetical protein
MDIIISAHIGGFSDITAIAAAQGWEAGTPCRKETGTPVVNFTSLDIVATLDIDFRERVQ